MQQNMGGGQGGYQQNNYGGGRGGFNKVNPQKFKTVLCRHFENNQSCSLGERCSFAHGAHEIRGFTDVIKLAGINVDCYSPYRRRQCTDPTTIITTTTIIITTTSVTKEVIAAMVVLTTRPLNARTTIMVSRYFKDYLKSAFNFTLSFFTFVLNEIE